MLCLQAPSVICCYIFNLLWMGRFLNHISGGAYIETISNFCYSATHLITDTKLFASCDCIYQSANNCHYDQFILSIGIAVIQENFFRNEKTKGHFLSCKHITAYTLFLAAILFIEFASSSRHSEFLEFLNTTMLSLRAKNSTVEV